MIKRISIPLLLSFIILSLAGCVTTGTPGAATSAPTNIHPTLAPSPTYTPLPPTETPTSVPPTAVPPTATETTPPQKVIQHFPSPQQFTVTAIHMVDANNGWAIGGLGNVGDHVLFTQDGGSTWKDITPPEPASNSGDNKSAVGYFQDALNAWVTYTYTGFIIPTQAVVWHTQDGGASWQASRPLDLSGLSETFAPSDLLFINGHSGWLLAHVGAGMNHDYVTLYHSQDGGISWTQLINPNNDGGIQSCHKTAIVFTDATHGWLTGDCNSVAPGVLLFKTSDGGASWQSLDLPDPLGAQGLFTDPNVACGSYDPFFFSNDLGHLGVRCYNFTVSPMTHNYYIYTTRDGGATWTSSTYPGESLYFISPDTGWAVSQKIQRTKDGGGTWSVLTNVDWTAKFDFISEKVGWGVAQTGDAIALVRSIDGGMIWSQLTPKVMP
jgi:photosystem II stability/assembly factor-like uncharacterized protein